MGTLLLMVLGWPLLALAAALPHSVQESVPLDRLGEREPTCDQLRAMWLFSKRQSRAAQITNEIPTYRDPFAYTVWESMQGGRGGQGQAGTPDYGNIRFRNGARPVYGRMQSSPPRWRNSPAGRIRTFEDSSRLYSGQPHRTARISGGGLPPQQTGSFQHLKEMIRQERLREVQEQRLAEEAAAARQLKDNSKPHFGRVLNGPASSLDLVLASANNKRSAAAASSAEVEADPEDVLSPDQVEASDGEDLPAPAAAPPALPEGSRFVM
ncbi:Coatomer subunit alpha [Frankliniella fusca]|uniref:Coatomer subunit alpha n=1 Tax=Frankliniella fusca TaxID=407009 RepID=A0AAE1LCM8_9NEOP|nr:Coatomer subunit alpha [Frankliniella fusca]